MEKEFVTYELALRMKQLGFDELCFAWYDGRYTSSINENYCKNSEEWLNTTHCATPLYQQAFRWFRENHYAFHEVFIDCEPKMGVPLEEDLMFSFTIHFVKEDKFVIGHRNTYQTQEEAELACLEKLIEIVEQK